MITPGDLQRPARIQVVDHERRRLTRPWKRIPVWRTVFAGFIHSARHDMRGSTTMTLEDAMSRLGRKRVI